MWLWNCIFFFIQVYSPLSVLQSRTWSFEPDVNRWTLDIEVVLSVEVRAWSKWWIDSTEELASFVADIGGIVLLFVIVPALVT